MLTGSLNHHFCIVPDAVCYMTYPCGLYKGSRLKVSERLLLSKIMTISRYTKFIKKNDELADYIGVTPRQIKSILKKLVDGGFIEIIGKTSNRELHPTDLSLKIWSDIWKIGREKDFTSTQSAREINFPKLGQKNALSREVFCNTTNIKKKKENLSKNFIPPTLEEVSTYIKENSLVISAEKFCNYYNAVTPPWTNSAGKPLGDWRRTLLSWNSRENQKSKNYSSWENRTAVGDESNAQSDSDARHAAGFSW